MRRVRGVLPAHLAAVLPQEREHRVGHREKHGVRVQLPEPRPAQAILLRRELRVLDGPLHERGALLLGRVQLVQPPQEQEVGHLLDDLQGVGDAARPERVPDAVHLGLQLAGDHRISVGHRGSVAIRGV
ncbi:Uncharacterised protein [Streptococcus pneumoniae]|nr:Uncharacterised protein [Streptococcus pneumoniae]